MCLFEATFSHRDTNFDGCIGTHHGRGSGSQNVEARLRIRFRSAFTLRYASLPCQIGYIRSCRSRLLKIERLAAEMLLCATLQHVLEAVGN